MVSCKVLQLLFSVYNQTQNVTWPVNCLFLGLDPRAPLPPGVSMLPAQKQRVPPPPGEDNREVSRLLYV